MPIAITDDLIASVKKEFGPDAKRIAHAMSVYGYAQEIMESEGGEPEIITAAALLHDIGIQEAERKHGSSDGKYQELEGPAIARKIMENMGLDPDDTDHVCRIVGSHHSAKDIDTLEFQIIWDSDWLVNLRDDPGGTIVDEKFIDRIFKTEKGKAKARELFIGNSGSNH